MFEVVLVLEEQSTVLVKALTESSPANHSARRTVTLDYCTTAIAIKISLTTITMAVSMLKKQHKN